MPINDSRSLARSTKTAIVHKVIDITPDPETSSTKAPASKILAAMDHHRGGVFAAAAVIFAVVVAMLARQ